MSVPPQSGVPAPTVDISAWLIMKLLVFLSYVIWSATSLYSLRKYHKKFGPDLKRFAYVTFLICAINSTMGITELYDEDVMSSMKVLLELLQATLALPCLTTEVWLKYEVAQPEVAWLHSIIGLIPTYIFLFQHYTRQDLIDFTVVTNMVSLAGVGVVFKDIFAVGASGLIFMSYCVFHHRSEMGYDNYQEALFNISMALYTFCGYKAVM